MNTYTQLNTVPAIVAFGQFESKEEVVCANEFSYNYETQITKLPLFMGSDQKVTKSAELKSWLPKRYKNVNDDSVEK